MSKINLPKILFSFSLKQFHPDPGTNNLTQNPAVHMTLSYCRCTSDHAHTHNEQADSQQKRRLYPIRSKGKDARLLLTAVPVLTPPYLP
ncbi:hypothetical protein D3C78_938580 [compost metagenome]